MNPRQENILFLIVGSFLLALLFSIIPVPDWGTHIRPQWLALIVIYWSLLNPEKVGITTAWISGIILDILTANLLGANALSLALIAYITLNIYQRTRIFPLWQQSLVVFGLLLIEHLIHFWIIGITSEITPGYEYWLQPVVGLLIWPWLFILMSEIRHRLSGNL